MDLALRVRQIAQLALELAKRGKVDPEVVSELSEFLSSRRELDDIREEAGPIADQLLPRLKRVQAGGVPEDERDLVLKDTLRFLRLATAQSLTKASKPPAAPFPSRGPGGLPEPGLEMAFEPEPDLVHFSVTAPAKLVTQETFELMVWAHLEAQRDEMLRRARQAQGDDLTVKSKGPVSIAHNTELTVRVSIEGAEVDPAEGTMLWAGEIANTTFLVTPDAGVASLKGRVTIHVAGIRVAQILFALSVDGLEQTEQLHQTAFASYSSADRDEVLRVIQGLQKVAPNLDIFLDVAKLRAGEDWESRLWKEIPARDVFYLFWSQRAKASEWVEKEWRCALKERGVEFIDPIPLETPDVAPPPKELSTKHFNDWTLAFRKRAAG
ncbi:MAG: TIR domain-containing protein [Bryobacterales bacterium]|nr:TIR domain-containing protein [Bryobacterales bacterium]